MSPKFANIKPRQVVRALERAGFYIHTTTGSHVQLKHPQKPGRLTVPYHTRSDLPKGVWEFGEFGEFGGSLGTAPEL